MNFLRHIRGLGFVRPHARYIQSSAVVLGAIQSPSPSIDNTFGDEQDRSGTRIFASKRTTDILRSLFVLKLCSYDVVAKNSIVVREYVKVSCSQFVYMHVYLAWRKKVDNIFKSL